MQTSIANQVNLVNTAGLTLNFWDGDAGPKNNGVVNGGDGTWQSSAGNDNWTEATGVGQRALRRRRLRHLRRRAPATVTVDDSLGEVSVSGMQFATDGYCVEGDADRRSSAHTAIVRVGDGTAAGAGFTATIAAPLTGARGCARPTSAPSCSPAGPPTATPAARRSTAATIAISDDPSSERPGGSELRRRHAPVACRPDLSRSTGRTLDAGGGTLEASDPT